MNKTYPYSSNISAPGGMFRVSALCGTDMPFNKLPDQPVTTPHANGERFIVSKCVCRVNVNRTNVSQRPSARGVVMTLCLMRCRRRCAMDCIVVRREASERELNVAIEK